MAPSRWSGHPSRRGLFAHPGENPHQFGVTHYVSTSSKADPALVISTLRSLGQRIRLNQMKLRRAVSQRKAVQSNETTVRRELRSLKLRVQREIDAHPDVVRDLGFDPSSEG